MTVKRALSKRVKGHARPMTRREFMTNLGLATVGGAVVGGVAGAIAESESATKAMRTQMERQNTLETLGDLHQMLRHLEKTHSLPPQTLDLYVGRRGDTAIFDLPSYFYGVPRSTSLDVQQKCLDTITRMSPRIGQNSKLLTRYLVPGSLNRNFTRIQGDIERTRTDVVGQRNFFQRLGFGLGGLAILGYRTFTHPWVRKWFSRKSASFGTNRHRPVKRSSYLQPADSSKAPLSPYGSSGSSGSGAAGIKTAEIPGASTAVAEPIPLSEAALDAHERHGVPLLFLESLHGKVDLFSDQYKDWHALSELLLARKALKIGAHELGPLVHAQKKFGFGAGKLVKAARMSERLKDLLPRVDHDLAVGLSVALVHTVPDLKVLQSIHDLQRLRRIVSNHWENLERVTQESDWNDVGQLAGRLRMDEKTVSSESVLVRDLVNAERVDPDICERIATILARPESTRPYVNQSRLKLGTLLTRFENSERIEVERALRHLVDLGFVRKTELAGRSKKSEPSYSIEGGSSLHDRVTAAHLDARR